MRNAALITFLCVATLVFYSGCSRLYRPVSAWEQREFDKADRYVYPDDVRKDIAKYQSAVVAWPGVISKNAFLVHEDSVEAQLLVEHHYFDWIEDVASATGARFFLSPRGEGLFRTSWSFRKGVPIPEARKTLSPGNMVVVYGTPESVEGDTILLKCTYLRAIDKRDFGRVYDFGRAERPEK